MRLRRPILLAALGLALSGCGRPESGQVAPTAELPAATPTVEPPWPRPAQVSESSPPPLGARLPDLSATEIITVTDGWAGLSMIAPRERVFTWRRGAAGFEGGGRLSVGGWRVPAATGQVTNTVPLDVVADVARTLQRARLVDAPYTPLIQHTDDYPTIAVTLLVGGQEVTFFTASQGEQHLPWGCRIGGHEYAVAGEEPYRAFWMLRPYLADDVLERLTQQAQQSPTSTPVP